MIRRFNGTLLPIILLALIGNPARSQTRSIAKPKLIVFITIDAMRADYLPRFEKQLADYWQAQHGSSNDPDACRTIIFYGRGVRPGRYSEFARVVDMAPTLAAIVGVTPQEKLDGHVLQHAIR
jgi:predicted AlkP superfamily pyrophosphatase or phosphodiesterase